MGLRAEVDAAGSGWSAVEGAVRVTKGKTLGGCSFDAQPSAVKRSMVRGAKREEIVELFGAAFGTEPQMMDVDEGRMPAPGHLATAAVASLHGAPARGRDALGRALRFRAHVG